MFRNLAIILAICIALFVAVPAVDACNPCNSSLIVANARARVFFVTPSNASILTTQSVPFAVGGQNTFIREVRGPFGGLREREFIQSNGIGNNTTIIEQRRGLFPLFR